MVMEKNKCYNDDLLACQKKLVILELRAARVCVGICARTHVGGNTGHVALQHSDKEPLARQKTQFTRVAAVLC